LPYLLEIENTDHGIRTLQGNQKDNDYGQGSGNNGGDEAVYHANDDGDEHGNKDSNRQDLTQC
jgi:hypothetical protein